MKFIKKFLWAQIHKAEKTLAKKIAEEINRKNLSLYGLLQRQAVEKTFEYVNAHLSEALIFFEIEKFWQFSLKNISISGSILELGIYKGTKSTKYIADYLKNKTIHGFDSFEGLSEDWAGMYLEKGAFDLKGQLPEVPRNVVLHKGWFKDTLPEFLKENIESIAFLHMDCDIYSSHKTGLELLAPRIKPGTIIVLDDYFDFPNWWKHGFKAFAEFVKENGVEYEYLAYKGARERGTENGSVCVKIISIK